MIVRDRGDGWQVVLQIDHEDLSGAFAGAWADQGTRHGSLAIAAARHDDGWAVWERAPVVDAGEERSQTWSAHRACLAGRMHESARGSEPFFGP